MANQVKRSFGKKLHRLSSMLLAAVMLVLTAFTGAVSTTVGAEEPAYGGNIIVSTNARATRKCGQDVILEAGKTYYYSYFYMDVTSKNSSARGYFLTGVIKDGNGTDGGDVTPTHTTYDEEYNKVTYEFTAPADATKAPDQEGKVIMYLGISIPKSGYVFYFYSPCVYAADDESKTNLFEDASFTGYTLNKGTEHGTWYKPYSEQRSLNAPDICYSRASLEDIGGLDYFKKSDYERYAVMLAPDTTGMPYFGQFVELEVGKTYVYSNYYTAPNMYLYQHYYDNYDNKDLKDVEGAVTNLDSEWSKQTTVITVPSNEEYGYSEKRPIYIGFRGYKYAEPVYYYDFRLYDVENPEINLLNDPALYSGGAVDFDKNVWKSPYYNTNLNTSYSKVSLGEIGGKDIFKRADSERYLLKLDPANTGGPFFGQFITLDSGKKYTYSNYFSPDTQAYQEAYTVNPDFSGDPTPIASESALDPDWSKQSITFTVPEDESGHKLVWVGFRGAKGDAPFYYYDFELYEEGKPYLNLLSDRYLMDNGAAINSDVWKSPYNTKLKTFYSKVTLESINNIGGLNYFMAYSKKCDVTEDGVVDIRDMVRMKRYSVGSIEVLPNYRGDLDADGTVGGASDFVALKKELLK